MWTRGFVLLFCGTLLAGMGWIDRCSGQVTRSGNKLTSEVSTTPPPGFESEIADDFNLIHDTSTLNLSVWGGSFGGSNVPASYTVRVYDDGGCVPMMPMGVFVGLVPTLVTYDHTDIDLNVIYRYDFTVPQPLIAGVIWWISIQADDHPIPDQWGIEMTSNVVMCTALFRSNHFGFPDWVPTEQVPEPQDVHMEVTDGNPVPTRASTWGSIKALYRN